MLLGSADHRCAVSRPHCADGDSGCARAAALRRPPLRRVLALTKSEIRAQSGWVAEAAVARLLWQTIAPVPDDVCRAVAGSPSATLAACASALALADAAARRGQGELEARAKAEVEVETLRETARSVGWEVFDADDSSVGQMVDFGRPPVPCRRGALDRRARRASACGRVAARGERPTTQIRGVMVDAYPLARLAEVRA